MPLNAIQEQLLSATTQYYFDDIQEFCPSDVAIRAIKTVFTTEEIKEDEEFLRYGILDSINMLRNILQHPCPQNRNVSKLDDLSTYFLAGPGNIVYLVSEGEVANREDKAVTLRNGVVIPVGQILADKSSYMPVAEIKPNETAITAIEQEGILGLTAKGQATKADVVFSIQKQADAEIARLEQQSSDTFITTQNLLVGLQKAITICQDDKDHSQATTALASLEAALKSKQFDAALKNTLLKLGYLFYEKSSYARREKELDQQFLMRLGNAIAQEARDNLAKFNTEQRKIAEVQESIGKLRVKQAELTQSQGTLKLSIKERFWGDALKAKKLLESEFSAQWLAISTNEKNLQQHNEAFAKFRPDAAVIKEIEKFKEISTKIRHIDSEIESLHTTIRVIRLAKEEAIAKQKCKELQQKWLRHLRKNEMAQASNLFADLSQNPHFDINAKDIFGKQAIYYALFHNEILLAYKIAFEPKYQADIYDPHQFNFKNAALFKALCSEPKFAYSAWQAVIREEIVSTLDKFLFDFKNNPDSVSFDEIQRRFNTQFVFEFQEEFSKFIKKIEYGFLSYLYASRENLDVLNKTALLYEKLGQQAVFRKLCDERLERARFLLEQGLEGKPLRSFVEIDQLCKQIGRHDYFVQITSELRAELEKKLQSCLESKSYKREVDLQKIRQQFVWLNAENVYEERVKFFAKSSQLKNNLTVKETNVTSINTSQATTEVFAASVQTQGVELQAITVTERTNSPSQAAVGSSMGLSQDQNHLASEEKTNTDNSSFQQEMSKSSANAESKPHEMEIKEVSPESEQLSNPQIEQQKSRLVDLLGDILALPGHKENDGEKYRLLWSLHRKISGARLNTLEDVVIAAKQVFVLCLQRNKFGLTNTTTSGKKIRELLNSEKYNPLKMLLFSDKQVVKYRDIVSSTGASTIKFFSSSASHRQTMYGFYSTHQAALLKQEEIADLVAGKIKLKK